MEWKIFGQFSLAVGYLSFIIWEFYVLGFSEVIFLITFMLAMFTILISVFFFVKSNDILASIKEGVKDIARGVEDMKGKDIEIMGFSKEFERPTKKTEKLKKNRPVKKVGKK